MVDTRPHDRYWPRDAPVRWRGPLQRLVLWAVVLASGVAHLVLAAVYVTAVEGRSVGGFGDWILAVAWIGLAAFLVRNWWFFRWRIVLTPIGAAARLWLVGAWQG